MTDVFDGLRDDVRAAAFRRLLQTHLPVSSEELAADLGRPVEDMAPALALMHRQGQIGLDESGRAIASAGLSVVPDRHQIDIGERRFWTWCAWDILGIFGALSADGQAHSVSPHSGTEFEIRFERGRPTSTNLVLFIPEGNPRDEDCCENAYEQWCPNANFFEDEDAAKNWSQARDVRGRIVPIGDAAELAAGNWKALVAGVRT